MKALGRFVLGLLLAGAVAALAAPAARGTPASRAEASATDRTAPAAWVEPRFIPVSAGPSPGGALQTDAWTERARGMVACASGATPWALAMVDLASPPGVALRPSGDWIVTPYGSHRAYDVLLDGIPVLDARVALHRDREQSCVGLTVPCFLIEGNGPAENGLALPNANARGMALGLTAEEALGLSADVLGAEVATAARGIERVWWPGPESPRLAWMVVAPMTSPRRDELLILDAEDGALLARRDLLQHHSGSGAIFLPNPVAVSGDRELRDGDDVDAYREPATLHDLDGSGFLRGEWAALENPGGGAWRPDLRFDYSARDLHFEEVMAYHHVTETQRYLRELGYAQLNARAQRVCVHASAEDDSWYSPATRTIGFGDGGVDDAEDGDVIIHEYAHALFHDAVGQLGPGELAALSEGFADYLAASRTGDARVGDWDGAALVGGCLRDLRALRRYPADLCGDPHADGLIWAGALWRIREALGPLLADRLAIETLYYVTPVSSLAQAACAMRAVAEIMAQAEGDSAASVAVQAELVAAGLLAPSDAHPATVSDRLTVLPAGTRGAALLAFLAPAAGCYTVEIFDPTGRRACPVASRMLPAGLQSWPIQVSASDGLSIPSGLLFLRLRGPGMQQLGRLLVVR